MTAALKLTTFRIDEDTMADLQRIKQDVGIPVSEQVRRALQAWIDDHPPAKPAKRRK